MCSAPALRVRQDIETLASQAETVEPPLGALAMATFDDPSDGPRGDLSFGRAPG